MCIHIWRSENNWQSFLSIMWVPHIKFRLSSVVNLYFYKEQDGSILATNISFTEIIASTYDRSVSTRVSRINKYPLIFFFCAKFKPS